MSKIYTENKPDTDDNSKLNQLKFVDDNGQAIKYSIKALYRFGLSYEIGIVEANGEKSLVDIDSIRELIKHGYINNAKLHSNGRNILADQESCAILSISDKTPDKIVKILKNLEEKFIYIVHVDNLPKIGTSEKEDKTVNNREQLNTNRKVEEVKVVNTEDKDNTHIEVEKDDTDRYIAGLIYDLSEKLIAIKTNSKQIDLINVHGVKEYLKVEKREYNILAKKFSEATMHNFTPSMDNEYYTIRIDDISMQLAKELLGENQVEIAIPIPEKFKTKEEFEYSITGIEEAGFGDARFFDDKFIVITGIRATSLSKIKKILLEQFTQLQTGRYLKYYTDIWKYILSELPKNQFSKEEKIRSFIVTAQFERGHEEFCSKTQEKLEEAIDLFGIENLSEKVLNELIELYSISSESTKETDEAKIKVITDVLTEKKNAVKPKTLGMVVPSETKEDDDKDISTETIKFRTAEGEVKEAKVIEVPSNQLEKKNIAQNEATMEDKIGTQQSQMKNKDTSKNNTKILKTIPLDTRSNTRLNVTLYNNFVIINIENIANYTKISFDEFAITLESYVKNGIDVESIKKPIERMLLTLENAYKIEDIIEELRIM